MMLAERMLAFAAQAPGLQTRKALGSSLMTFVETLGATRFSCVYLRREAGGLTIGRADDNDLVARDGRVSRHHGRIVGRRGTLVYVDLGSTNGSRVNGESVNEVVLGIGDRLEIGDTELVVEVAGDTG